MENLDVRKTWMSGDLDVRKTWTSGDLDVRKTWTSGDLDVRNLDVQNLDVRNLDVRLPSALDTAQHDFRVYGTLPSRSTVRIPHLTSHILRADGSV